MNNGEGIPAAPQGLDLKPGQNGDGIARSQKDYTAPERPERSIASYNLNDLYHARKVVQHHGDNIRFCRKFRGFLVWNGNRWARDETGSLWQWAIETASTVFDEENNKPDQGSMPVKKWALNAKQRKNIENALRQLQAQPGIVATPDMFDRDPLLFNVSNGTIDLHTGALRKHRSEDLITKISPVTFDPEAAPPERWLQFLDEIFAGDKSLIDFVQGACGYALTGLVSEQKLFFLNGRGSNGKTTFLATLMHMMGEYVVKLAPGLLFSARRNTHPTGYADLKGSRLAVMPEIEFARRLSEVAVKELTGVDPLTARRARTDSIEFAPTHKLFMCGNHLPIVRGNEQASWQRIVLIPFPVAIPQVRQDRGLRDKLRAEAPGILNWLVKGCLEWQKNGLTEPADITEATRLYRSETDILGDFINECCVLEPCLQESSHDLNVALNEWRLKNGEMPIGGREFGMEMKDRGFVQIRVGAKRARTWAGIGLKTKKRQKTQ